MSGNVYMVADGHNNAAGLAALSVQPASPGPEPGTVDWVADGSRYEDGAERTSLDYSVLTPSEYTALLSELGLTSATSNQVTLRLPNRNRAFANYNATVHRPRRGREIRWRRVAGWWEAATFLVTGLEAL